MSAWYVAARWGKPELLQKIWDLAEEKLTAQYIKNKLLATEDMVDTIFHVAA
jgi:hypothetical protein